MPHFPNSTQKGFTLVETLIAISVFVVAVLLAGSILVSITQVQKKSSIQNEIYEDVRIILQQLTNEIQAGKIDYEEYYNMYVIQSGGNFAAGGPYYGINYGAYSSRFYDPGRTLYPGDALNPQDLGVECTYAASPAGPCEIYFTDSVDLNTGQNPYDLDGESNAFCDGGVGNCSLPFNEVEELYLIDNSGTKKTIIGKKLRYIDDVTAEPNYALGIMKMEGRDLDQNGVVDVFSCSADFNCHNDSVQIFEAIRYPFIRQQDAGYISANNIRLPQRDDLNSAFEVNASQFMPISPAKANITDLRFIIEPVEDPYLAFSERGVQGHPAVTIIMTVDLSSEEARNYPGDFPQITVQTTVDSEVFGRVNAYPPVNDVLMEAADESWITEVLPTGVN